MARSKTINPLKIKKAFFIVCMLAVPVLNLIVFWFYVNIDSILLAFQSNKPGVGTVWGFENFERFFKEFTLENSEIPIALKNTLIFFFANLCITLPCSVVLCYFLYKRITGYKAFRFIFYLPSIISASVYVVLFRYIIGSEGPVGLLIKAMGMRPIAFLSDSRYALGTILFYTIFTGLGGNIVMLSGAMSHIDESIVEAAKIDGASLWCELFRIVLPLIWPTLSTLIILSFVSIFAATGPILLFTEGAYDTNTLSYWLYAQVQRWQVYNYPSAVGLFFTFIGAPIALFMRWVMSKVPSYED